MKSKLFTIIAFVFVLNTSYSSVVILNGLTHIKPGVAGQTVYGEVVLANTTNIEQRITFELFDAIYSCETGRSFIKNHPHNNSSTNWFAGALMDKVLAPKEKYIYKYSITIPNDTNLKGSFWTTLMVNVEKPIKEQVIDKIGIDTKVRYGIRILTDVNYYDEVKLDFKTIDVKEDINSIQKALAVNINNQNKFIEEVKLTLEVYDVNGNPVLSNDSKKYKVFPNTCKEFLLDISALPKGEYQCIVIADSREELVGTNVNLSID